MSLGRLGARGGFGSLGRISGGVPLWVPPGAIIDEIFTTGQYYPRPIASELADVRASAAYAADASGVWSQFLSNVTRITNAGMTNEPTRTNSIRNNSMQGAVAGVVGSGGVLPTNWSGNLPLAGMTGSYALNSVNGLDFIQESVTGTATATATLQMLDAISAIAATPGQVWTASVFTQLLSGSLTTGFLGFDLAIREYDSAQTFLRQTLFSLQASSALVQRFSGTVTAGASTAFILAGTRANYAGGAVAFNLGIGWPQLELGATVTSPIRTTTAAVTRAADAITIQRTGIGRVVFTFDDNSQQTVSGINTAAQYTIPTNLNRPLIKRMTGYAA